MVFVVVDGSFDECSSRNIFFCDLSLLCEYLSHNFDVDSGANTAF